jgi:hypothetical protein
MLRMAFDKLDIVGVLNQDQHIGSVGDDGTYGRYMVAGPGDSLQRSRRMRPALEDRITYLYFIHSKVLGLVKIGFTSSLNMRKSDLQVGSADELCFLGAVMFANRERAESAEAEMKSHFHKFWSHGEWFHPDPTLLAFIKQVSKAEHIDAFVEQKRRAPRKRPVKSEFWPCGHKVEGYQSACTRCLLGN